jgi:hypothetical protein
MAFSRYTRDNINYSGLGLTLAGGIVELRRAMRAGIIPVQQRLLVTQADRLDTLAGTLYGDSRYWWVLAVASDIGWGMQVPPGTYIIVPDLKSIEAFIG